MHKSEQINEITKALVSFQMEAKDIQKDSKGYGYDYASLEAMLKEIRPLLCKNGLVISSGGVDHGTNDSVVVVATTLMHISGQWLSSTFRFKLNEKVRNVVQESGAVISYIRRYAMAAMLNLTQVDNDGEMEKVETQMGYPVLPNTNSQVYIQNVSGGTAQLITDETYNEMIGLINDTKTNEYFGNWLIKHNIETLTEISERQGLFWITSLSEKLNAK